MEENILGPFVENQVIDFPQEEFRINNEFSTELDVFTFPPIDDDRPTTKAINPVYVSKATKSVIALGLLRSLKKKPIAQAPSSPAPVVPASLSLPLVVSVKEPKISKKSATKIKTSSRLPPLPGKNAKGKLKNLKLIRDENLSKQNGFDSDKSPSTANLYLPKVFNMPVVNCNQETVEKWKKAERCISLLSLPKIMNTEEAEQERNEMEELKEEEKEKFSRLIDELPHISADLSNKKINLQFWQCFCESETTETEPLDIELKRTSINDNENECKPLNNEYPKLNVNKILSSKHNVNNFLRFCQLHADNEKQRKVFYAMCARQLVKERQLNLLKADRDSYRERANFVARLTASQNDGNSMSVEQSFLSLIKRFTEKSFELCSLKCREYYLEKKVLNKNRKNEETNKQKWELLLWDIKRQKRFNKILDVKIGEIAAQFF